jgi:protein adenylyltransferase
MRFGFQHTYSALPGHFWTRVEPARVAHPQLVAFNSRLARELGLDPDVLEPQAASVFSGNDLPEDAQPIAMAYAGHQFGVFVPRLGDGRAILLGELVGRDGIRRDIQLKGAGRTPYSRSGDGRAVLGPMLREYLVSEAMHALGVPTTRSLAVVTTGEAVFRGGALPGAILTRVAASHVRVGTFQYFAARGDQDAIRVLLKYVMERHYPAIGPATVPALALLEEVARRQAALVADWMLIGFIHGVMNTDNMAISGETIDYGPCAFMDAYDPATVFSSIDHGGRYAYANQPAVAQWNLAQLAETLLFLIDPDPDKAVSLATEVIDRFMHQFDTDFLAGMRRKLGLSSHMDGDVALIRRLLAAMQDSHADFTLTFRALTLAADDDSRQRDSFLELFNGSPDADAWLRDWHSRVRRDPQTASDRMAAMRSANPAFIPRNHRVEAALDAANNGDYSLFHKLFAVLQSPYDDQVDLNEYSRAPLPSERVRETFCGT